LKSALKYLKEILFLLDEDRKKIPWMILIFWISSLLDLVGLGLISPYIALILRPESAEEGRLGELVKLLGFPQEQETLLLILGFILLSVFLIKAIASIGVYYFIIRFGEKQKIRIISRLVQSYQALPYTTYLQRNSSEYIYNISALVKNFTGGVVQNGLRMLSDLIVAVMIFVLLAWNNAVALGILFVLLSTLVIVYDQIFRRKISLYGQQMNQVWTSMIQGIKESIEGLKEIRILGKEYHFYKNIRSNANKSYSISILSSLITAGPRYLLELTIISFVVMLITVTISGGQNIHNLIGTLGLFGVASLRLVPSVNTGISTLLQLRQQRNTVSRLYNDIASFKQTEIVCQPKTPYSRPETFQTLIMKQVSFSYPITHQKALNQISLEIRSDESIGLIGPSGSGKTTLVDVLLGLLEPQSGEIIFNGKPLNLNLKQWRSQVAYIPQETFLIDNTLRCNVALGTPETEINDLRLQEALSKALLLEVVEQMPLGLDTLLGERGVRLSGGQRQRVALARSFYHGRNILVMDEATSALDNETESEIIEEIKHLKGQKTLFVIAHRLSTVQHCDRIYRLENGEIVESGTPEQVLNFNKMASV